MKRKLCIGIILMASLLPLRLLAWGKVGHQLVAQLAMHQLSQEAKARVLQILNGMTPEQAATWMDDIRRDTAYRYTASWHFINVEKDSSYHPSSANNIINALNKAYTELQTDTLSAERAKFDLLVIFHLCGDLLQPLHVGYGVDKGGNDVQVNFNGKGTNLHHIWDTEIIENQNITLTDLQDTTKAPTKRSIRKLRKQKIDFVKNLKEGRRFLPEVYSFEGHKLDESYMQKNKALVEEQLQDGGKLLAACLEHLFGKS
jgi:hypothetical protein